jgi:retinol-binding protein 3
MSWSAMRRAVVLVLFVLAAGAGRAQTAVPDTAAGRTLKAWLTAFNSADRAQVETFVKTLNPKETVDGMMSFRGQTGGFELLEINRSEPLQIDFKVKEKASPTTAFGSLKVKDAASGVVESLDLSAAPPGAVYEAFALDAAARAKVIDEISAKLAEFYVYPEGAARMSDAIKAHEKNGDYKSIDSGAEFAKRLTDDLRAVSHDKHLGVRFHAFKSPAGGNEHKGPSPEEMEAFRKQLQRSNCAWDKAEVLPGNIGYVKFDAFPPPDMCGATVTAAMDFIGHTDAVIIDLRENHGGSPAMVSFIASYFFADRTHLNDMYNRHEDTTEQYWSLPYVPGARFAKQPVYVLTSHGTFSGGEEFTYDMQTQKRATIVGETTGGGAHPMSGMPLDDHFEIGMPGGRPINPVTKRDWEGTGVEPDVKVKADDALDTALKLAREKLAAK